LESGARSTRITQSAGRLLMATPGSRLLAPSHFPRPRLPPRLIIEEEHHRPDLVLRQELFPRRHRRIPGRPFARQPRPALGDAPEDEALGELRDRAVVLEVGRQGIEPRGEVPLAVQMVAVAGYAVLIVDATPDREVRRHLTRAAQRIVETDERDRLAAERDL